MNLYKLHSEPTKLEGYNKRLQVPKFAWEDMNDMLTDKYTNNWRYEVTADKRLRHIVFDDTEHYRNIFIDDAETAYRYVRDIIQERWPDAEEVIYASEEYGWQYDDIIEYFEERRAI